jgi:ubiquinone/menaquinone biosynthesis C-methylase UbiE
MTQLCAVRDFFARIAPEYDQRYKNNISQWENKIIHSVLYSVLSKGKSWILDIDCGTGLGYDLSLRSIYVGVDISEHMLQIGKYQFPDASLLDEREMTELKG